MIDSDVRGVRADSSTLPSSESYVHQILVLVLKDHLGLSTEPEILQQAFLAAMRAVQAFHSPPPNTFRYNSNNTYVMVASATAFVLKTLTKWRKVSVAFEHEKDVFLWLHV